jgi:hypothetical protein
MSSDFDTKLVYDARLQDLSDKLDFSVRKGGADVTWQRFTANSQSSSSMNFTVNPPSESTIIDRRIFIKSTVKFRITIGAVTVGQSALDMGLNQAFQSFPLSRLFDTCTLTINNVSTSVNLNHVLPAILRMIPQRVLQEYEGLTPSMLDQYGEAGFVDAAAAQNNSPLAGFKRSGYDCLLQPRGVHPIDVFAVTHNITGGGTDDSLISTDLLDTWEVDIDATFTEPLFVAPMLFGDPKFNHSGYLGVNNFQLVLNIDSEMRRFFSGVRGGASTYAFSLRGGQNAPFGDTSLLLNFLTAPMPFILPPKLALPYSSYTSYITSFAAVNSGLEGSRDINSIQLEVIPDKIFIYIRKTLGNQRFTDPDTFLPITGVTCTFSNKSGLLSNANQQQLYKLSRKNGSEIDWYGFSGESLVSDPAQASRFRKIPTCGSLLVIDPAMDFGLQAPYLTNGSVGQYNLQLRVSYKATPAANIGEAQLIVIVKRDGIVTTSAGQSTLTTNMVNTDIVMKTMEAETEAMSSAVEDRLVGGMGEMPSMGFSVKKKKGGVRSAGQSDIGSRLAALAM